MKTGYILLLIFLAAFAVRLIYLFHIVDIPSFAYPVMDEKYHIQLADRINSPEGLEKEPYFRAPLYPYALAFLRKLTDDSLFFTRLIQIIIGSLIPLLVYHLGSILFNRKTAGVSAFIAIIYPTFIYYDACLLITSFMTLLVLLLIWQLYRTQKKPVLLNFILSGVLLGITALARPNILLLGPVLIVWILFVIRGAVGFKKTIVGYAAIGIASLIIILPVTIRNYQVSNDFVFIAWQGGFNFFLGNNQEASGWSATAPGIDRTWEGGYRQAIGIANHESERTLKHSEISDFWYAKAFDEIKQDPLGFVALEIRKLRLFFNGYEIPNNQSLYIISDYFPLLMYTGLLYFPFGVVAPLALIGLALSLRHWRRYLLLYSVMGAYIFSLVLFFVCARFRQPLMPFMILLAVHAVFVINDLVKKKKAKTVIAIVLVFVLLLFECNRDMLGRDENYVKADDYFTLGAALMEYGKKRDAEKYFRKALEYDPTYAEAGNNLGIILSEQGDYAGALQNFQTAVRADFQNIEYHVNMATTLILMQKWNKAINVLQQALKLSPGNAIIFYKLGIAYYRSGRLNKAAAFLDRSLRIDPNNAHARQIFNEIMSKKKKSG